MFAAAMAFSLGIKLDAIRQGLRTFDSTFFQAPGRMNVFNEHPFKVLFDYGHNAHAVGMMADLAQRLDVTGRRIVVLAGPGDRRDEDLVAIAKAVAGRFDHYICRRDDNLRNRASDEVPRIQAAALRAAGVREDGDLDHPGRTGSHRRGAAHGQAGRPAADFRRCAGALVEADHQVQDSWLQAAPQGIATRSVTPQTLLGVAARETASGGAAGTAHSETAHSAAEKWNGGGGSGEQAAFSLEGLIRDERGVRFAPEAED